jgi:hypothetical protein
MQMCVQAWVVSSSASGISSLCGLFVALVCLWLQVVLFVPVIYVMIGFTMVWEKAIYYAFMFLCSISFYTIFGQFMVYVTPSQQIAQVSTHFVGGMCIRLAPSRTNTVVLQTAVTGTPAD